MAATTAAKKGARLFGFALLAAIGVEWISRREAKLSFPLLVAVWSASQWSPGVLRRRVERFVWERWEREEAEQRRLSDVPGRLSLKIPSVDVQRHRTNLLPHLEATYGADWRDRPLLLRGLWSPDELRDDESNRTLSLRGLLRQNNLTVPYFTDARRRDALTPDAVAPISQIVARIVEGRPHKIGSQWLVQRSPELIREVAPSDVVTTLFGDHFAPQALEKWGPWKVLPALTTVPLFVSGQQPTSAAPPTEVSSASKPAGDDPPHTALHCEPIGNVAVQLSGRKDWTLVDPEHWHLLRPLRSPDGRAFVASALDDEARRALVPSYFATTIAGDALWVPTWTWHRVTYPPDPDVAIGASLFHFRPRDFVMRNPALAALVAPSLLFELVGRNTQ